MKAKAVTFNLLVVLGVVFALTVIPVTGKASEPTQSATSTVLAGRLTGTLTESLSVENVLPLSPHRAVDFNLPTPYINTPQANVGTTQLANQFTIKTPMISNTGGAPPLWNSFEYQPRTMAQPLNPTASLAIAASFSEGFDDVTTLVGKGWAMQNNSAPLGITNWYQGVNSVFPAHTGVITSYIAANFNSTGGTGTISNWLLTPEIQIKNGDRITFYTRAPTGSTYPDRLEVRMSQAGASTNVGTSETSVGVFTTTLLSINPTLAVHGYPEAWTMYSVAVSCLPAPVNGRFGLRYFVTNGGPSGSNSNYLGIDTFSYTSGATVLYDNGPLVTNPGAGFGGANASAVQTSLGLGTYGFGHAVSTGYRVADNFTVTAPCGWDVESFTFFGYQTGSTTTSTLNAVNYRIWNGAPGAVGSNVLFGDTTTNRLTSSTFSNIYRVLDTDLAGSTRPVMSNTVRAGFHLAPGTYWADWQSGGTLASGPWAPQISFSGTITTGDALQFNPAGATWGPVIDGGTGAQQGLPFVINRVVQWKTYLPLVRR
jgi:hypothetical protein